MRLPFVFTERAPIEISLQTNGHEWSCTTCSLQRAMIFLNLYSVVSVIDTDRGSVQSELPKMLYIYIRTGSKLRTPLPADNQGRIITNFRVEAERDYPNISPDFAAVVNWLTIYQVNTTPSQFSQCTDRPI